MRGLQQASIVAEEFGRDTFYVHRKSLKIIRSMLKRSKEVPEDVFKRFLEALHTGDAKEDDVIILVDTAGVEVTFDNVEDMVGKLGG